MIEGLMMGELNDKFLLLLLLVVLLMCNSSGPKKKWYLSYFDLSHVL